jgi:hypothetical protein
MLARLAAIAAALLACAPGPALAEDEAPAPGARLGFLVGQVEYLGPEAETWKPAEINLTLQPGDRLRTGPEARAELQFEGGAVFRLGAETEAELLAVGRSPVVRLVAGRGYARAPRVENESITVEAGDRSAGAAGWSAFRVDLEREATRGSFTVTAGRVAVEGGGRRVELDRGERLTPADGEPVPLGYLARDDFDRWNADRDAALAHVAAPDRPVPAYVPGAHDLDAHGSWVRVEEHGWVWRPYVAAGWRPYAHGRWVWRPYYGWVWLAPEPWAWAPYHYGRWVVVGAWGWVWVPGSRFSVVIGAPYAPPPPVIVPAPVIVRPIHVHPRPIVIVRPPVVIQHPVVVERPVVTHPPRRRPPPVTGTPVVGVPPERRPAPVINRPVLVERPAPVVQQPPAVVQPPPAAVVRPEPGHHRPLPVQRPAVIERPRVVERPVQVERPSHVGRPAPVERPVAVERPVVVERPGRAQGAPAVREHGGGQRPSRRPAPGGLVREGMKEARTR